MPRALPLDISSPEISANLSQHSIPLQSWKTAHVGLNNLAIGAFILRSNPTDANVSQMLLLKRSSSDSFPNMWEPPGGSVDTEDLTLFHGLVREVWEETGLRVTKVLKQVWDKDNSGKTEVTFPGRREGMWCKLNFLVEVQQGEGGKEAEVQIDENEHQDWGWFTKDEMEKLDFVSVQAREIARNAFASFEKA